MNKSAEQIELEAQCKELMRLIYGKGHVSTMDRGPHRPRREWMCTKHDDVNLFGDSVYGYSPEEAITAMRTRLAERLESDRIGMGRKLAEHTTEAARLAQRVAESDAILSEISGPSKRKVQSFFRGMP